MTMPTESPTRPAIEYRFNARPAQGRCPVCNSEFQSSIGMWPFIAGADQAVCGRPECPTGEEVTGPAPCDTMFEFVELAPETIAALRSMDAGLSVAERFRTVSLGDGMPEHDCKVLQLAAIDLQYCTADRTCIEEFEPRLVLRTCGEAAAELLLSGCGEIVDD